MNLSTDPAQRGRHLLVVDDDDRIRELLKAYLARAGFRVSAANGGPAARKLLAALDFDLAVFDVMMLDYRGYVAESTGSNVFFVKDGVIHTPLPDCFLNGITRQSVIRLARSKGLEVVERHIKPEELSGFS